jgi:transcriptional regulator of met regulon
MKKIATLEMNFCMNDGILTEASTHANTQQPLSLGHDIKRER